MATLEITDKTFISEVVYPVMAVLVDVHTPHCGPCRSLSPIIDKLAAELRNKIKIVKLDAAEYPELAASLGVRAVPSLIAFREGVEAARKTGFVPEPKLRSWIEEIVEGDLVRKPDNIPSEGA